MQRGSRPESGLMAESSADIASGGNRYSVKARDLRGVKKVGLNPAAIRQSRIQPRR
jgi:hypothetical protein